MAQNVPQTITDNLIISAIFDIDKGLNHKKLGLDRGGAYNTARRPIVTKKLCNENPNNAYR